MVSWAKTRPNQVRKQQNCANCASFPLQYAFFCRRHFSLTISVSKVDRAVLEGTTASSLRLILEKGSERILGATVVSSHAGDLLGELCLAATDRIGLSRISSTIHPYTTVVEIVSKAGDQWRRGRLTPLVLKALQLPLRLIC